MHRISGLDGVRALAIILVIGLHMAQRTHASLLYGIFHGQDGVNLFFVLSGFLVTALLLREHARTGQVRILDFYYRRSMRILPPLLAYLLCVVAIGRITGDPVGRHVILSVVFFYHNMCGDGTWMLEHTWSLAIEEQFYLLWPLLLVGVMRINRRGLPAACIALMVLAPVLRVGGFLLHWHWLHNRESLLLPARMDALLAGCLVASVAGKPRFERLYQRAERAFWMAPVVLFVVSPTLFARYGGAWNFTVGYTLDSVGAAFLILWLSRNEQHLLGRLSNHKAVTTLGVMSYSIYLWQTLATRYATNLLTSMGALAFLAAAACASFFLVEKPSLILRNRLRQMFRPSPRPAAAMQVQPRRPARWTSPAASGFEIGVPARFHHLPMDQQASHQPQQMDQPMAAAMS
ncbi:acyltransferase [Acidipila sp. EB88]|uniref:acyltransferase family protein n=1 Tax=Acidipila sp. EB88 TaxID=2305226 RepID=UPI000F600E94|nr:acyltransferase [Acidipila sp. EB88]